MSNRDKILLALLVAAIAMLGGGVAVRTLARGIRNNNPGNIKRTAIGWRGEVPDAEKSDPTFEEFIAPEWGIRAMAKEILTNLARGQNTIRQIITEWSATDQAAYIANVSSRTGIDADEPVTERDIPALIGAIIVQENGFNPYPVDVITAGIRLA